MLHISRRVNLSGEAQKWKFHGRRVGKAAKNPEAGFFGIANRLGILNVRVPSAPGGKFVVLVLHAYSGSFRKILWTWLGALHQTLQSFGWLGKLKPRSPGTRL